MFVVSAESDLGSLHRVDVDSAIDVSEVYFGAICMGDVSVEYEKVLILQDPSWRAFGATRGGGFEYLHRSLASSSRRQKGNTVPGM
jgi:hypothetical protein